MKKLNIYIFYSLGLFAMVSTIVLPTLFATQKEPISDVINSFKKGLNKVKKTGTSIKDQIKSTITNSDLVLVNDTDYDVYFTLHINNLAQLIKLGKHSKKRHIPQMRDGCLKKVESMMVLPINYGSTVKYEILTQTIEKVTDSSCTKDNDYDIKVTQKKIEQKATPGGGLTKTTSVTFTLSVQDRHGQQPIQSDTTNPQKILYEIVEWGD